MVVGPAVGGLLFALGPELVYATAAVLMLIAVGFVVPMKLRAIEEAPFRDRRLAPGVAPGRAPLRPADAGAARRDLARPRGGAVRRRGRAAAGLRARRLDVGPVGLGVLRSAPAVGAMLAGIMLTRRPLRGKRGAEAPDRGRRLRREHGRLRALSARSRSRSSRSGVSGFADMISMNIRSMITGARDSGRAAREGERGRDGLHQRVERARRLRVGRGGGPDRRGAGGRDRRAR